MKNVHFGAGNIGRGFIGEILFKNGFDITFVDINAEIIDALKERGNYEIEIADEAKDRIAVTNVTGLNNQQEPEAVVAAIAEADLVTTAIGPNVLPFIAELIAKGIQARRAADIQQPIDVIACENMIGGSDFLKEKVMTHLSEEDLTYVEAYVGFPNAAVDRIVPIQSHEDPLFVSVEPFSEWVIDASMSKAKQLYLEGVTYVEDLEPYIERKLFSVNTGHATVAYNGSYQGYETIDESLKDPEVLAQLSALTSGEIEDIDQREYVEIEYHTDTPPAPNLRQQFEEALAPNRYRLVRISRRYLTSDQNNQQQAAINLDPPTPEKLFQNLWEKQGYGADDTVMKDFLSLVDEAQKSLEDDANA